MSLPPGARLGPYEIVSLVGAGGMGDVYKARDTRLERTVAIKVSKSAFEERFRNEARAVAALNHGHICALYDVGPDYLVMEYVEGKPLRGPLSVAETLRRAGEIAEALEHAHRYGIVHRDLKPSNILVTKGGVKVLDFGLAKRREPGRPAGDSQPTLTEEGTLLGTPQYMAPEQIDGRKADERTDVFALGMVLYEMLTGRRPFEGKSAAGVMAAILEKDPPPLSAVKPDIPPALEQVIATCLAKDPADRWQSIRELRHALGWAARPVPAPARRQGRTGAWIAALVAAAIFGVGGGLALRSGRAEHLLPVRLQIPLPANARLRWSATLAVSPNGRQIAFPLQLDGGRTLALRSLDSLELWPVPGTEGATRPFWSPDGKRIGFAAGFESLKKVDLAGGPPQTICALPGFLEAASWGPDNVILFSARSRLYRVPARGGEPEAVGALAPGEIGRAMPVFLPDGRHYLYLSLTARPEDRAVYAGSFDSDLRKRIVSTSSAVAYSSTGHLLFLRGDTLMGQRFDAGRLELSGEPFAVVDQVGRSSGPQYAGEAFFSVSGNGVVAWRPGPLWDVLQLTWLDRSGRKLGTLGEAGAYFRPTLSPDEKSVAVCRSEGDVRNLWILDAARGSSRRLTFDAADNCGQSWSPDGARLAFFSNRRGVREIYEKRVDGSGEDELVLSSSDVPLHVEDWSADGRFLAYNSTGAKSPSTLFLLSMSAGPRKPIPFLTEAFVQQGAAFSPNGRWIAYWSNETGRVEVYVKGVSADGVAGQGKWQISRDGGIAPRWRRDGKELFYVEGSKIMAVDVRTEASSFEAGVPRALFEAPMSESPPDRPFDVTRDGLRFLVNTPVKPREPIRVLVNWLSRP
jgi:Tol biopolymer transport system component